MPLILNIDTATDIASVCISVDGHAVAYRENIQQKEHASFVHKAVETVLEEAGKELKHLDAFAVTSGPGSYTGLRVGLATAKGFCYALQKPLITINTLKVMAEAAITEQPASPERNNILFCPMIDARRMEVYTALFNVNRQIILVPPSIVLDGRSFDRWLKNNRILFFGSGSQKFKNIVNHINASFANISHTSIHLGNLATQQYNNKQFADVAYAEPEYIKDFYSTSIH